MGRTSSFPGSLFEMSKTVRYIRQFSRFIARHAKESKEYQDDDAGIY